MATGRNKLLRYARIYVGGYDLSGDARTFSELMRGYAEQDMTGWSDQIRKYLADQRLDVGIRGFQALMNDTANSGAFSQLKTPDGITAEQVSVAFGGGAAPAAGDISYLLTGVQLNDPITLDGQAETIVADFLPKPGAMDGNPMGVVLFPDASLSATTNGTTVDNGASSADGWLANLHVIASGGGTWAYKIQHSTNGSDWSTLDDFTLDGSTVTSEHVSGTTTVNRYVRGVATRTSSTCNVIMTFSRK